MPLAPKYTALLFAAGLLLSFHVWHMHAYAHHNNNIPAPPFSSPFNISEAHSTDISPFYKWTSVLARMDALPNTPRPWSDNKTHLKTLALADMAQKVNDMINKYAYVADQIIYGKSDYWAAPAEFFLHGGGDCEDFAIAKYGWLRSLGVSDEKMRIAIVYDRVKNLPHALLIVYIGSEAMLLDSQIKDIRTTTATSRYRPIYSINRSGWWYPTKQEKLILSMAQTTPENKFGTMNPPEPATNEPAFKFSPDCLTGTSTLQCLNAIEPFAQ